MKNSAIIYMLVACMVQASADDLIPKEICGRWQTPIRKNLKWDLPYKTLFIVVQQNGRCPLVLSPPNYGATLLIQEADKKDEYFYRIDDQGKFVEEGILRFNRVADTIVISLFGQELSLIRESKLLNREP